MIEPKTIKSWEELARDIETARKFAMDNNCWVISAKQISSNSLLKVKGKENSPEKRTCREKETC